MLDEATAVVATREEEVKESERGTEVVGARVGGRDAER